jgi:hypothetical protein
MLVDQGHPELFGARAPGHGLNPLHALDDTPSDGVL